MTLPMTESELLDRYARHGDQEAFGRLVGMHMGWVYGCARRMVQDPATSEDIAQAVFVLLARKAPRLRRQGDLAPWLFRATRYCALQAIRRRSRRLRHEREAAMLREEITNGHAVDAQEWDRVRPVVDDAVAALRNTDRTVILLRYFQGLSVEEVGRATGSSTEAAKKRVQRAVARLRDVLQRRGVMTSAEGLAGMMVANLQFPTPPALTEAAVQLATATATAAASPVLGLANGAQTLFMLARLKTAAAVVLAVGMAGGLGTAFAVNAPATAAATRPVAAAAPSGAPESLDGMYERAPRSGPELHFTAGPNRFGVVAVARWDGNGFVAGDGRGGVRQLGPDPLRGISGPRQQSPFEDVAVVLLDTPPERFDVRRLRVCDHDRREMLHDVALQRVPGTSAFRIVRWYAPLPSRIDLWLDLASHGADSQPAVLQATKGASARIGDATIRVRELRDGLWNHQSRQTAEGLAEITWGQNLDGTEHATVVLDCVGAAPQERYQLTAVRASGHRVMSDLFESFVGNRTTIRDFPVTLADLARIEIQPFARPGPFFFDGVALPPRTTPMSTRIPTPPTVVEGRWEAVTQSGPTVSIVAIADYDRPDVWWTPDGRPTGKPPRFDGQSWQFTANKQQISRVFCLRMTGLDGLDTPHFRIGGARGWSGGQRGDLMFLATALPKEMQATSVQIGVSTKPWELIEEYPLDQPGWLSMAPVWIAHTDLDRADPLLRIEQSVLPDGMAMQFVDYAGNVQHHRLMTSRAVEASESGLLQRSTITFRELPAGLESIVIKWRPVEWLEFRDVRLNPR